MRNERAAAARRQAAPLMKVFRIIHRARLRKVASHAKNARVAELRAASPFGQQIHRELQGKSGIAMSELMTAVGLPVWDQTLREAQWLASVLEHFGWHMRQINLGPGPSTQRWFPPNEE